MNATPILEPSAAYALWAGSYPAHAHNPVMLAEERAMLGLLPGDLRGQSVVDAGCGSGRYTRHAVERGARRARRRPVTGDAGACRRRARRHRCARLGRAGAGRSGVVAVAFGRGRHHALRPGDRTPPATRTAAGGTAPGDPSRRPDPLQRRASHRPRAGLAARLQARRAALCGAPYPAPLQPLARGLARASACSSSTCSNRCSMPRTSPRARTSIARPSTCLSRWYSSCAVPPESLRPTS